MSPKKQVQTEQGPESPLKWCRKVLDHPSPETEVACRTLLSRLDQSTRCTPETHTVTLPCALLCMSKVNIYEEIASFQIYKDRARMILELECNLPLRK